MPKSLADAVPHPPTILMVGPAGSGKSTFAYRFPKPYVLNADINMAGPRKALSAEGKSLNVKYDNIHIDDEDKPVEPLQRFLRFAALLKRGVEDKEVETIILDSITALVPVFMNEVLRQLGKTEGTAFVIQDWGKLLFLFTSVFDKLRACGKTVIICGHFDVEKGEIDQVLRYILAIPGQSATRVPILATDMWWFSVETSQGQGGTLVPKYVIRTIQDERHPNIKTSLTLPSKFDATQEWVDKIVEQIKPAQKQ